MISYPHSLCLWYCLLLSTPCMPSGQDLALWLSQTSFSLLSLAPGVKEGQGGRDIFDKLHITLFQQRLSRATGHLWAQQAALQSKVNVPCKGTVVLVALSWHMYIQWWWCNYIIKAIQICSYFADLNNKTTNNCEGDYSNIVHIFGLT